ncbi:MAG: hypothetical protein NTV11_19175 [Rhodocyclales bacterium]|nr:hypothetical protein [Rhodocyclales bacterium]
MALYAYKAMNIHGRTVLGRLEAINPIDLEMRLKRMDLDFINGDTVKQGGMMNRAKISRPELINFCFHLEQLARAGVSLIESLTDLRGVSDFLCVRRSETFPRCGLPKVPLDRRRAARWESRWSF